MQRSLSVTGCLALLLLTAACGKATFFDPTAEIRQAAEEAFADLAEQPALKVAGSLSDFGGGAAEFEATVLADGTAWASFATDEDEGEILSLPGSTHLRADDEFWRFDDYAPDTLDLLDGEWARLDAKTWFGPGKVFNPSTFGPNMYKDLDDRGAFQIATPETVVVDGMDAYPIGFGGGTINISVKVPHRLLSVDNAMLTVPDRVFNNPTLGSFSITVAEKSDIEAAHAAAGEVLSGMDESVIGAPSTRAVHRDATLDCPSAICTYSVTAKAKLEPDESLKEVSLVLSASVDGGDLGVKSCTDKRIAEPNVSVTLACSTDFSHVTGEQSVYGKQFVYWMGVYTFDSASAIEALNATVEEILAG